MTDSIETTWPSTTRDDPDIEGSPWKQGMKGDGLRRKIKYVDSIEKILEYIGSTEVMLSPGNR